MREAISSKKRFDVFKRDGFTCQYCGAKTPNAVLEVDHIIPVCKGGSNNIDNLITSCFDCNRGKGKHELSQVPESLADKYAKMAEKEKQYKAFVKLQNSINKRMELEIEQVCEAYSNYFPEYTLTDKFKSGTVKNFISKLGVNDVVEAMVKAAIKTNHSQHATKYFCGICWNIIKEKGII